METKKENLLVTLSSRRRENAKNQLKSILLESYEIFGESFVQEVSDTCKDIYTEYAKIVGHE